MAFLPGNNANPNGARGARRWKSALDRALARAGEGDIDAGLNLIADKVLEAAMSGDKDAWKEIAERQDGKVATVVVGDASADAVQVDHNHTVTLVKPNG